MDIRAATPLRILGPSIPTPTRPVSARLRQHRVHNEMEAGRRWEANWGWLAAPAGAGGDPATAAAAGPTSSKVATKDSMDRFLASHEGSCTSTIKLSLRAQKQQLQQPQGHYKVTASAGSASSSSSSLEQPAQAARSGGSGGGDAVDQFVRQYMFKCGGASMRSVSRGPHSHMQGPAICHIPVHGLHVHVVLGHRRCVSFLCRHLRGAGCGYVESLLGTAVYNNWEGC